MASSFCLLGVESRDFPHAEKETTACSAEQINKMTTIQYLVTFLFYYYSNVIHFESE